MPPGLYWTGTEISGGGAYAVSLFANGKIEFRGYKPGASGPQALCISAESAAKSKAAKAAEYAETEKAVKAAGAIALAPNHMNWDDAKAYCASKGGKLPLVGGKTSLDAVGPKENLGLPIDVFGSVGAKWPSGLPDDDYWTGSRRVNETDRACCVRGDDGKISVNSIRRRGLSRVVCVP